MFFSARPILSRICATRSWYLAKLRSLPSRSGSPLLNSRRSSASFFSSLRSSSLRIRAARRQHALPGAVDARNGGVAAGAAAALPARRRRLAAGAAIALGMSSTLRRLGESVNPRAVLVDAFVDDGVGGV
jgi:outer membrane scaffolding protein for murein synthesis (MipA/OmpV family)